MYVRPAYRGRGIARQLLVALEEEALHAGYAQLRLETGTYLPAAIGLYRSAGYQPIAAYGEYVHNPYSVCFAKRELGLTSAQRDCPAVNSACAGPARCRRF